MFHDYAKFIIGLMERLDRAGLALCDLGTFNGTFNGGNFIYIDFPAVRRAKISYPVFLHFLMFYVNILHLLAKKRIDKAYLYMRNILVHCTFGDIAGLLEDDEAVRYKSMENRCIDCLRKGDTAELFALTRAYVNGIQLPRAVTPWRGYQKNLYSERLLESEWTGKQKTVVNWVRTNDIKTMIDLAGNEGFFSLALSGVLDYAISVDLDHGCVDDLYESVREKKIKNVIPVYMNIVTATPPFFRGENCGGAPIGPFLNGARDRFKCDCALALAVTHHLAMRQCLDFSEIISVLSSYTTRYLIVEFIDRDDKTLRDISDDFGWYTRLNFEAAIAGQSFVILDRALSSPETRTLYLCERTAARTAD
jgi:hypothetical protein